MWAIENQTPFAAECTFVRDRDGSEIWLVAVRATFTISPDGLLRVSEEQDPVAQAPKYFGKPGKSSLRCDTDLPRTKPGTDVLINGTAYVPNGKPQTEIEVGFRVGDLQKKLLVSGPAVWEKSLGFTVPGTPQPFTQMPITYERAFGGQMNEKTSSSLYPYSESNPMGVGIDATLGAALPSVRYPGSRIEKPPANRPVAGFGAVAAITTLHQNGPDLVLEELGLLGREFRAKGRRRGQHPDCERQALHASRERFTCPYTSVGR